MERLQSLKDYKQHTIFKLHNIDGRVKECVPQATKKTAGRLALTATLAFGVACGDDNDGIDYEARREVSRLNTQIAQLKDNGQDRTNYEERTNTYTSQRTESSSFTTWPPREFIVVEIEDDSVATVYNGCVIKGDIEPGVPGAWWVEWHDDNPYTSLTTEFRREAEVRAPYGASGFCNIPPNERERLFHYMNQNDNRQHELHIYPGGQPQGRRQ